MKTVFSLNRKHLRCPVYVRVYENINSKMMGYCIHFSEEERESHENFNRYRHRSLYRLNVYPKSTAVRGAVGATQ